MDQDQTSNYTRRLCLCDVVFNPERCRRWLYMEFRRHLREIFHALAGQEQSGRGEGTSDAQPRTQVAVDSTQVGGLATILFILHRHSGLDRESNVGAKKYAVLPRDALHLDSRIRGNDGNTH